MISRTVDKLRDPEYRKAFVLSQINVGIPFQIRALMKSRGWTQAQLAEKTHMLQPRISELVSPGKTRPNVETLRRIAQAFDCALIVKLAPFSELVRWSEEFDPESFNVPTFTDDPGFIERKPQAKAPFSQRPTQPSLEDAQRFPVTNLGIMLARPAPQSLVAQTQSVPLGCTG
jgi:transcriptional regulator with XRE-family HTH domain